MYFSIFAIYLVHGIRVPLLYGGMSYQCPKCYKGPFSSEQAARNCCMDSPREPGDDGNYTPPDSTPEFSDEKKELIARTTRLTAKRVEDANVAIRDIDNYSQQLMSIEDQISSRVKEAANAHYDVYNMKKHIKWLTERVYKEEYDNWKQSDTDHRKIEDLSKHKAEAADNAHQSLLKDLKRLVDAGVIDGIASQRPPVVLSPNATDRLSTYDNLLLPGKREIVFGPSEYPTPDAAPEKNDFYDNRVEWIEHYYENNDLHKYRYPSAYAVLPEVKVASVEEVLDYQDLASERKHMIDKQQQFLTNQDESLKDAKHALLLAREEAISAAEQIPLIRIKRDKVRQKITAKLEEIVIAEAKRVGVEKAMAIIRKYVNPEILYDAGEIAQSIKDELVELAPYIASFQRRKEYGQVMHGAAGTRGSLIKICEGIRASTYVHLNPESAMEVEQEMSASIGIFTDELQSQGLRHIEGWDRLKEVIIFFNGNPDDNAD